jgi:hypothetical protein
MPTVKMELEVLFPPMLLFTLKLNSSPGNDSYPSTAYGKIRDLTELYELRYFKVYNTIKNAERKLSIGSTGAKES